jgi:hypothetical protein
MSDDEKWSVRFRLTRFDIRRYIMVKQERGERIQKGGGAF